MYGPATRRKTEDQCPWPRRNDHGHAAPIVFASNIPA